MGTMERYDMLMKMIIIGDSGTGKSCLLHRFVEDRFVDDQTHTIGVEFGAKIVDLLGKRVKLQIWDTAGQERYRSVTRSYYRGAVGCLLVYDVTCRESYDHVPQWLSDARGLAGKDIVVMLVGNKVDLVRGDARQVTNIEASQLAQQHGLMMFETSALTGEFVEEAFLKVVKTALMRQQEDTPAAAQPARADVGGTAGAGGRRQGCSC
eukprot:TRINITY_DN3033_c0_g2_i1.p1 TRINITY_DN3033_c0_g2~~TRINITY_DN3033_c0_g2_i1.p1  ORF type:complete len:238 (+),score=77.65 TRINITY_DN3033_c0_g2_i1:92-715(+)